MCYTFSKQSYMYELPCYGNGIRTAYDDFIYKTGSGFCTYLTLLKHFKYKMYVHITNGCLQLQRIKNVHNTNKRGLFVCFNIHVAIFYLLRKLLRMLLHVLIKHRVITILTHESMIVYHYYYQLHGVLVMFSLQLGYICMTWTCSLTGACCLGRENMTFIRFMSNT